MCKKDCLALAALVKESELEHKGAVNFKRFVELADLHGFRADVMPDSVIVHVPYKSLWNEASGITPYVVRTWEELGDVLGY